MGKREYSEHTFYRAFRVVNFFWMGTWSVLARMRPIGSRFLGLSNGPLNYSGLYVYLMSTMLIFAGCKL